MWKWFDVTEVDRFAEQIVAELTGRFPVSGVEVHGKKAVERVRKTFSSIFAKVDAFARSADLNLYKKARLGNRIRWALTEAGYPGEFVEEMTRELVMHLAVAASRDAGKPPAG